MNKHQNGNIAVPIVVIAVLALLGAVGYLFWTNYMAGSSTQEEQQAASQVQEQPDSVQLTTGNLDSSFPAQLSWQYPATWRSSSEGRGPHFSGESTDQKITLTSPSGKYSVIYRASVNGGLGGMCHPEEQGTFQHVKLEGVDSFADAVFGEFIYSTYEGVGSEKKQVGYEYSTGLFQNVPEVQNTQVGDSVCNIYLRNVFNLSTEENMQLLESSITINTDAEMDLNTIKTAFEQPEYQEAVKILKSTKKQ